MRKDLLYAVRNMVRNPGVSAVAVLPLQGRAMDGPVEIGDRRVPARFNAVGDGHFALGGDQDAAGLGLDAL